MPLAASLHRRVRPGRPTWPALAAVGLAAATLTLAGCSSASQEHQGDRIDVVASTNVWGSVASAVAGDLADVHAIIDQPSADPHSYEVSPRDAAALIDADLVVYNGGGYDEFIDDVLRDLDHKPTVNAFALHTGESDLHEHEEHPETTTAATEDAVPAADGHDHDHGGVNEHVWYDLDTVDAVAHAIAAELGGLDPDNAAAYTANAEAFHGKLHTLADRTADIAARHGGSPIAQTEPIAAYLVAAADLIDRTPADFTKAIEEGNDPPPAAIAATRDLLRDKQVDALIYNTQTEDKVTLDVRTVAEATGIPVVEVTETLPAGVDYVQWQTSIIDSLSAALDGAAR